MTPLLRSPYFWLIGILLVVVVAYAGWRLTSKPVLPTYSTTEESVEEVITPVDEISAPVSEGKDATGTTTAPVLEDLDSTDITAEDIDDFAACYDDAHNYCSGLYLGNWQDYANENGYTTASWKYSLLDCLAAHRDQTSQACDDSLDRRQALNEALNTACRSDRRTFCAGIEPKPGSEPEVDCLKENYEKLSDECAVALDAHEAAKPVKQ